MFKRIIPFLFLAAALIAFGCSEDDPVEPTPDPDPQCGLSTITLAFGDVALGDSADMNVTVTNTGGQTLVDTMVSVPCADFRIIGDAHFSLGAGQSATLTVRFKPAGLGQKTCPYVFASRRCGDVIASGNGIAASMSFAPVKDNTLFETTTQEWSNGQGHYLFVGKTSFNAALKLRRAVMKFDVSTIPAGAVIDSAWLEVTVSKVPSGGNGNQALTIHRLTLDWGEGASKALGNEGAGAGPEMGDATWTHAFFDTDTWITPGGDFVAGPSASSTLGGVGTYKIRSTGIAGDVAFWRTNAATNFGWILIGNEGVNQTAKRLDSRHPTVPPAAASTPPKLTVYYTP